jgi:DNA-directed RNA polymerase specialized sigma24 family protein
LSPEAHETAGQAFDTDTCSRLLDAVQSTAEPAWRELVAVLWPELTRIVRSSRTMASFARSEDHVRSVVLLVVERLGKDGCRAASLHRAWRETHPDRTLGDWLRIVTTNVARDYVRERKGRAALAEGEEPADKRMVASLATLLPDDDELEPTAGLSATSAYAVRELARWARQRLPPDQLAALDSWLQGGRFEEIAQEIGVADGAAANRVVRAALAALRRHAAEGA